nr:MAG TPA: bifunctional HTH-domain containing protein/aminotransferase [Caudoviricetes sp.]
MKKYTTAERLKQIMKEREMKQVDILELVLPVCKKYGLKMNKSDISQYVSGKVEPNQRKLVALAEALNVSETWLMGYEIEEKELRNEEEKGKSFAKLIFNENMLDAVIKLGKLQPEDKEMVVNLINSLYEKIEK